MKPDDKLCYCFHISRRKVENFCRVQQPRVASQLAECGGAGTGCGWCIPFLKRIFASWKENAVDSADEITAQEYAARRATYIRDGGGTPPPGAEAIPD